MVRTAAVAILLAAPLLAPTPACRADEPGGEHAWLTLAEGWTQLLLHHHEQAAEAFDSVIDRDRACAWAYAGRGWVRAQRQQAGRAERDFSRAIEIAPRAAALYYLRASLYHAQHREALALADCDKALHLAPEVAAIHLLKAGVHGARREYDAALACCQHALELCSGNGAAHRIAGIVHARTGNLDAALAELSLSLERAPSAATYKLRAHVWLRKWCLAAAVADLNRAVRLEPRDIEALVLRSGIHLVRRDYAQAVADCSRAIRVDPHCGAAYANRGAAHFKQGERELALADFNRAIQLNPADLESLGNRAQLYGKMGQWDRVVADCTAVLLRKPGWRKYRQLRLHAYLQRDELLAAQQDVVSLLQLQPGDAGGYLENGDLYLLLARLCVPGGRLAELGERCPSLALRSYDQAIRLEPACGEGYCKRAALHLQMEHYPEALADSSEALRLQPGNKKARIVHLQASRALHHPKTALADCTQLVRLCGDQAERRQWIGERACLAEDLGNEEEAEADYSEYIQLDPQDPEGWQRRAAYLSRHGGDRRAIKDLNRALGLQHGKTTPEGLAGLHLQRARLLARTGDLRGALKDYTVLVRLLPHWTRLHFERALLLALVGEYTQALESGRQGCQLVLERSLRH